MAIDIVEYLNHLLHRNNVAILPGLGAFIAAPTPAVIDHARGILHPPSKVISFNENLKINDGFLINHIRNQHGVTANDARLAVENFVRSVQGVLSSGETVLLDKIGKLHVNPQGKLVFEADKKTNFNPATFGLPEIKYQPIDRRVQTETPVSAPVNNPVPTPSSEKIAAIKEAIATPAVETIAAPEPSESTPETKQKPLIAWLPSRNTSLLAAGLLSATLLTGIYMYKSKSDATVGSEDSAIQVSENRLNVKPSKDLENTTTSENITTTSETPSVPSDNPPIEKIAEKPAVVEKYIEPKASENPSDLSSEKSSTVVFLGSFSSERNAKRIAKRLKRKGFEVYREKHNGLRRVGTPVEFSTEKEKNRKIALLRRVFGKQCWTR